MPFVSLVPATKPSTGPVMGPVALAMTFFTLLCAATLIAILRLNHRTFTYTLDDPYLHLSLAENIVAGHYGINRDDVAAPSSSVLWPYLLAPFSRLPFGYLVPLFLNYAASLGTIALLGRMISTSLEGSNEKPVKLGVVFLVVFLILAANLVGLAFTGMEHSLQVLLSVALVAGLIEETTTARVPSWLPAAIVAGPLVRYENLALSLPALALLACRGRAILAAGCLAALLLGLGGFSLYLHGMGLGWVPLSVSAKSGVIAGGGSLASVLRNLRLNLRPGLGLLFCLAAFVAVARRPRTPADRALALWAAAAVVLHMLVGRFGWFFRYEIYVWISSLVMLIFLFRDGLRRVVERVPAHGIAAALAVLLIVACRGYLGALALTPLGANNIYEQQYQMHRFAADFHAAPVGVNDLGLVSYRNHHDVLDLEGLASPETREVRRAAARSAWMDTLCARHGVKLAMVYDSVFPEIPPSWVPLGRLRLAKRRVTPMDSVVTFWAVDRPAAAAAMAELLEFRKTLPPGVRFDFEDARARR